MSIPHRFLGITFPSATRTIYQLQNTFASGPVRIVGLDPMDLTTDMQAIRGVLMHHPDRWLLPAFEGFRICPSASMGRQLVGFSGGREYPLDYTRVVESPATRFANAAREAVRPTTTKVRTLAFATHTVINCPETGVLITTETSDVDHAKPWTFAAIVDAWHISQRAYFEARHQEDCGHPERTKYWRDRVMTEGPPPGGWLHEWGDWDRSLFAEGYAIPFREYHDARATLRVVSAVANRFLLRAE